MKNKLLLAVAINTSFLMGCTSISENFVKYQPVSMQKADIMPSKGELSGKKVKIVLFEPGDGSINMAKKAKVGHSISSRLEKYLAEAGAETVDRKIASKLKSELKLAESKGLSEYQGPDIADYAVNGEITNAVVGATFTKRSVYVSSDGKRYVTPAYCRYSANITGNMKVYALPALTYTKTISIEGYASFKSETSNSRCPISKSSQYSLLRSAAENSVKHSRIEFQSFLAPKAYVLEHRMFDGDSIFKISAGSGLGFKADSGVEFFTKTKNTNALTGETSIETYPVSGGEVVKGLVSPNYSWVTIDDKEKALTIKLGDLVKLHFQKGFLEGALDGLNNVLK